LGLKLFYIFTPGKELCFDSVHVESILTAIVASLLVFLHI